MAHKSALTKFGCSTTVAGRVTLSYRTSPKLARTDAARPSAWAAGRCRSTTLRAKTYAAKNGVRLNGPTIRAKTGTTPQRRACKCRNLKASTSTATGSYTVRPLSPGVAHTLMQKAKRRLGTKRMYRKR